MWSSLLGWSDLIVFAIMYIATGLGITVGFHRLFTHRSFKTGKAVRAILAALGSAAIEGPVISWVADHRKHHAYSDQPGDPHSPHVDHGHGLKGALRGLLHAHVGWLFIHTERGLKSRYAPDLIADPIVSFINRTFVLWVVGRARRAVPARLADRRHARRRRSPACCGAARCGCSCCTTRPTASTRCATSSAASASTTGDESRNLWWLSFFTFGEAWHNNHHAFPTSARHGLSRWNFDPSAWVIWALEKTGLAWDVVRIPPERQAAKLAT